MNRDPMLHRIVTRMAAEGIPIEAIKRVSQVPIGLVESLIDSAVARGDVPKRPERDWPGDERRVEPRRLDYQEIEKVSLSFRAKLGFPPAVARLCAAFVLYQVLSRPEALLIVSKGKPNPKIVDIRVCQLRDLLTPRGFEIQTLWGTGYAISDETREGLIRLVHS